MVDKNENLTRGKENKTVELRFARYLTRKLQEKSIVFFHWYRQPDIVKCKWSRKKHIFQLAFLITIYNRMCGVQYRIVRWLFSTPYFSHWNDCKESDRISLHLLTWETFCATLTFYTVLMFIYCTDRTFKMIDIINLLFFALTRSKILAINEFVHSKGFLHVKFKFKVFYVNQKSCNNANPATKPKK